MLDDYLHIVDTARWLANDELNVVHNMMQINEKNELLYGHHTYTTANGLLLSTAMHRHAGTNLEQIELVTAGKIIRVKTWTHLKLNRKTLFHKVVPLMGNDVKTTRFWRCCSSFYWLCTRRHKAVSRWIRRIKNAANAPISTEWYKQKLKRIHFSEFTFIPISLYFSRKFL